jgi:hypothetical protein
VDVSYCSWKIKAVSLPQVRYVHLSPIAEKGKKAAEMKLDKVAN